MILSLVTFLGILCFTSGAVVPEPRAELDETYGYIDVRPGCHMFYVIYENEDTSTADWTESPLIMWLQGGPGSSSVGYGNFWELGPYNMNGTLREHRWTLEGNLLFVDNPVGTGYSYVDDLADLTTTNQQIADDLVEFTRQLFADIPDLQMMPYYIYAESYGGKMTVDYALGLYQAIEAGEIVADFRGVGLIDSWISPMDSVNTWGSFLHGVGFVSAEEQSAIDDEAAITQGLVDAGQWVAATDAWGDTEVEILIQTGGINFYNVFYTEDLSSPPPQLMNSKRNFVDMTPGLQGLYNRHVLPEARDSLDDFMNGPQRAAWNISDSVTFGGQSNAVFNTLAGDFMKPVIDSVEVLLNTTNIHVAVITGNFDLICDTPGTYRWIDGMNWNTKSDWLAARRIMLEVSTYEPQAGYVRRSGQFSLFTALRSGHMVPIDQGELSRKIINLVEEYTAVVPLAEKNQANEEKIAETIKIKKLEKEEEELKDEVEKLNAKLEEYKQHEMETRRMKAKMAAAAAAKRHHGSHKHH